MTELLCSWLNEDIKLNQNITKESLENDFSNGYLIGEILNKHGLQDDFSSFSKGRSSESKLSNFMKLEPTLRLLQIPFDTNTIHEVIVGKKGTATKLLYQLFISLKRKKQNQWTSQTMEVMRPQAKARLETIQMDFFQQRLKQQVPRQVDLTFKQLIEKFEEQKKKRDKILTKQQQVEDDLVMEKRKVACKESLQKHRDVRVAQAEMYKKLEPLNLPSKDTRGSNGSGNRTKTDARRKRKILEETMREIAEFEENHNLTPKSLSSSFEMDTNPLENKLKVTNDDSYFTEIKARAREDRSARRDREARRRKLLVDQMKLIRQKEDQERESSLANRLMRQSLQEKRVATQLMQIRKEKDNIRNNRIERQKQYEEERNRIFHEAMDREALMAAREREEQKLMLQVQKERRKKIMLQRAREHYEKHYSLAMGMVKEIVMLSMKIGEYRELTEGSIPDKFIRDWKLLFVKGVSLSEEDALTNSSTSSEGSFHDQQDCDDLLDDEDFKEYLEVKNEWSVTETDEPIPNLPGDHNLVLTHIAHRLIEMVTPPQSVPSPPSVPTFKLKGACLGLPFTGKTTILTELSNTYENFVILSPAKLVEKALQVYHEETTPPPEPEPVEEEEDNIIEQQLEEKKKGGDKNNSKRSSARKTVNKKTEVVDQSKEEEMNKEESNEEQDEPPLQPMKELSEIGKLGERVYTAVTNGDVISDETVVDILITEIRSLTDGCSWVIDNYPTTLYQAQLLATGLTGQGTNALKQQSDNAKQRAHNFVLIPNREVQEEELQNLRAACGLDFVIHFNASVNTVLARSTQQQATADCVDSPDVQECLLSFDDNWPKVKRWFNQFRILTEIDANSDMSEVSKLVKNILNKKFEKLKEIESLTKYGITLLLKTDGYDLSSRSTSKMTNKNNKGGGKKQDDVKKSSSSPQMRKRRPSSAGGTRPIIKRTDDNELIAVEDKSRKRKSAEEVLFEMMDPSTQPGDHSWMHVDEILNSEMIQSLSQRWPMVEKNYLLTFRGVFRQLRRERDNVCHYLYNRRQEFYKYLKRPDNKQEFVCQWQHSYNQIESHVRREDIMKAELHHRVEDLIDKLWDICEVRKKEAEQERENIINDQWLIDKMGVVSNHYISLMNCELIKFQDIVLLLKDYYAAMQEDTPIAALPSANERLPLIQVPVAPLPGEPPSVTSSRQTLKKESEENETNEQEAKIEKEKEKGEITEKPKCSVPLVPREPPTVPDPAAEEKSKRKSTLELMTPPREDISGLELDEQLVVHSYNTAIAGIFKLMNSEVGILEAASVEANKKPATPVAQPAETKGDKSSGKGKKGAKSPGGKKGKTTPKDKKGGDSSTNATPNRISVSPAELAKKQQGEKMRREHMFALKHEEAIVKSRVQLIKVKALEFIAYLKSNSSTLYQKMEDWIGEFYQQEVKSVGQVGEVLRSTIEMETKLKYELVMPGVDFEIHQNVLMYPPTPPVSPPPPRESTHPIQFTSLQLISLYNQLKAIAPDGTITLQKLITFIHYLVNKSFGENMFPVIWIGLTKDTVSQMCNAIYGKKAKLVQWVRFFQFAAQPYIDPSHEDLLKAMESFKDLPKEQRNIEGFMTVPLWFDEEEIRERTIKQLLLEAFSLIDSSFSYSKLLFMLCNSSNIISGIRKAFTLAVHMDCSKKPVMKNNTAICGTDITGTDPDPTGTDPDPTGTDPDPTGTDPDPTGTDPDPTGTDPDPTVTDVEDNTEMKKDQQLFVSTNAFFEVLFHGSHDNEITLQIVERLYCKLNKGEATPIALNVLMENKSALELLDKCVDYQLPDVGLFLSRSYSSEPPLTPANDV